MSEIRVLVDDECKTLGIRVCVSHKKKSNDGELIC